MPAAGQIIRAADFDGYASVSSTTDETNFNTTTYSLGGGTVGIAFTAPTSGEVLVLWSARGRLNSATGERILVTVAVLTGSVVGSGTTVSGTSDSDALEWGEAAGHRLHAGTSRHVTGLTAGSTYNVSMWHRNAVSVASAGSIFDRSIKVIPWLG